MSLLSSGDDRDSWPLSCNFEPFEALLFDLDGTLVDTMPLHGLAYGEVFAGLGHHFTLDDYLAHVGPPARVAIPAFAKAAGMGVIGEDVVASIHREKKIRFKDVLAREKAPSLTAAALLARFAGRKPMALVTSGNRDGVEAILRTMGWRDQFGAVVTGDDVTNGKPHPDPYLMGARLLGVRPEACLVLEDTQSGIDAAIAAGMSVIDVTQPGAISLASER